VTTLDRLVDDTLLLTGPDGSLATKSDDLSIPRSGAMRFMTHEPSDFRSQAGTPDDVVVALRTRLAGFIHG